MKVSTLRQCPKKAFWGTLKLSGGTSVNIFKIYDDVIGALLREGAFNALRNSKKVRELLEKAIPEDAFIMHHEREENLSKITERIVRMGEIFIAQNFTFVDSGKRYTYTVNNKALTGDYQFVARNAGVNYGVKIVYGSYGYSMKEGTKTHISTDTDLYVQSLATNMQPMVFSICGNESMSAEVKDYDLEELVDSKKMFGRFLYTWNFNQDHEFADQELQALTSIVVSPHTTENHQYCERCNYKELCQIDNTDNFVEEEELLGAPLAGDRIRWTEAQKQLISTRKGEVRVYAVAGSGKTTSIAETVVQMLKDGINKNNICLCTFTNKGVQEIKNKISQRLAADHVDTCTADSLYITSLNALGMDIIKYHALKHEKTIPALVDENDYLMLIAKIMDQFPVIEGLNYSQPLMKMFNAKGAVHQMAQYFDLIRRDTADQDVQDIKTVYAILSQDSSSKALLNKDGVFNPISLNSIRQMYNDLRKEMMEKNWVTYDDQIHRAARILNEDHGSLNHFRKLCQYMIVDEFQDTGVDQMRLVEQLYVPSDHSVLIVVGDASQSIMGFRGVGNDNLLNFQQAYPNSKTIDMNANFRSTREICDIAEKVMFNNHVKVSLVSEQHGTPVVIENVSMKEASISRAAEIIEEWLEDGKQPQEIAVIARTRKELLSLRHILDAAQIPTVISVSEYLKDDNQIIGAINLADYLNDSGNFKALAVWLRHTKSDAFDSAVNPADYLALQAALINEEFANLSDVDKYAKFVQALHDAYDSHMTNAMKTYFKYEETQNSSFARASGYLNLIATTQSNAGAEREEGNYEAVTLTTVHSAKGREWPNVIVVTNGFKQVSLKSDATGMVNVKFDPEEIRTLFVAVTRARETEVLLTNAYWAAALNNDATVPFDVLKASGIKVTAPPKPKKKVTKKK